MGPDSLLPMSAILLMLTELLLVYFSIRAKGRTFSPFLANRRIVSSDRKAGNKLNFTR